jgi:hypothetical protein
MLSINEVTVSSILLQHMNQKCSLSTHTHRLWKTKKVYFVWCWSLQMNIVSEEYGNKLLPLHCIVMILTCSGDIQQSRVNLTIHVFWNEMLCHLVSTGILMESIIPLLGPLKPWRWRHYIPSKHQETLTHWHYIISQKTWIVNSTTVRTRMSQSAGLQYTNIANKRFIVMWT